MPVMARTIRDDLRASRQGNADDRSNSGKDSWHVGAASAIG